MYIFPNFHPWIGKNFGHDSCFGVRLLVVGESHYWEHDPHDQPDCLQFPNIWARTTHLTQEVVVDWGQNRRGSARFFTNVSNVLRMRNDGGSYEDENGEMWNHVAFYDYVQSYVEWQHEAGRPNRPTDDQWDEGKDPFDTILQILKPDAILMLGGPNNGTSGWIAHNHNHDKFSGLYTPYEHNGIIFLGIYHPSAINWPLNRAIASFRDLIKNSRKRIRPNG